MFRLTREVRFAVNRESPDPQWRHGATNSYGGYPTLSGFGQFLVLRVTLRGELQAKSQYVINIKEIDTAVREMLPAVAPTIHELDPGAGAGVDGEVI